MSDEKVAAEARRWLLTARGDLESARVLKAGGRWAHACFHALRDLSDAASDLDQFNIPTRYPNGLPDLTPDQVFTEAMAIRADSLATAIIDRIAALMH